MKAKKVYENLGFKRGQEPKKSLGIGKFKDIHKFPDLRDPEILYYYEKFNRRVKMTGLPNWNKAYGWVWSYDLGDKKEKLFAIIDAKYYN